MYIYTIDNDMRKRCSHKLNPINTIRSDNYTRFLLLPKKYEVCSRDDTLHFN